ncbi:hypothetical protein GCM10010503_55730 [Streptomyces lucensis JCM 4490]|uniref:Uncharacterized protein n=1 Tax=Streptomyces lucensis JCM 4490 TaxID=1306176 RepID=A0A918MU46_9ACTN|nr:hypothetical protein GCM10010503_55730 [Streptomyces lucensis JCM 4490]
MTSGRPAGAVSSPLCVMSSPFTAPCTLSPGRPAGPGGDTGTRRTRADTAHAPTVPVAALPRASRGDGVGPWQPAGPGPAESPWRAATGVASRAPRGPDRAAR